MNQQHTVNVQLTPSPPSPPPPRPPHNIPSTYPLPINENLPCADLVENKDKDDYFKICVPLYEASITGDWAAAKLILEGWPELVRFAITESFETMLHVAASADETKLTVRFVENIVEMMTEEDLELQNLSSNTAFCIATATGNIKMATIMMNKNPTVLSIPGIQGKMPLFLSALQGKYETTNYLYDQSQQLNDNSNTKYVLQRCVECNFFDIALKIVKAHRGLAEDGYLLGLLAQKPHAFNSLEQNSLMRILNSIPRIIYKMGEHAEEDTDAFKLLTHIWTKTIRIMPTSKVEDVLRGPCDPIHKDGSPQFSSRILFLATKLGNTRFVIELLRAYPYLMMEQDDDNHTIFHIAVMNRHLGIYNLLYEIGTMKNMITQTTDNDGNNMLHLVGKTTKKMRARTSKASLLMQRELLWYMEVEKMTPLSQRDRKNKNGQTPYDLFSEENKDLVSQGLKWTNDCMVVSTLIITVAFAVAFTLPGGYNQENGIPIFVHEPSFLVFVIADAISLFSSSTSLLVFLSILTSRHGQRDFMYSLPKKLMIGLVTLFISVATMLITFSASFFVLYCNRLKWVPILVSTFTLMPVIVFAILQLPLLVDMFLSTYDSRYLFKPKKRSLYNSRPRS